MIHDDNNVISDTVHFPLSAISFFTHILSTLTHNFISWIILSSLSLSLLSLFLLSPICPGCQLKLDSLHFLKCTSLVQKVIGSLRINCKYGCRYLVTFDSLQQHEATCRELPHDNLPRWSHTEATIGEVLEVPLSQPLSADEEALCSRLVRRSARDE